MTVCYQEQDGRRSSQLHKMCQSRCTAKNSWWWAERLPEICRVVLPIELEFGAYVGFYSRGAYERLLWIYLLAFNIPSMSVYSILCLCLRANWLERMWTALFLVITQRVAVISYRRLGTAILSHLQESSTSRWRPEITYRTYEFTR